ncbi:FAD binding domain-containing protein [Atractiella rhizophila]|nr:FAD binding domain-containing protein [Atractiella rhizophila]
MVSLLLLSTLVFATVSQAQNASTESIRSSATCEYFSGNNQVDVDYFLSLDYQTDLVYWNAGCAALKPACILFPKNADEVSLVVKQLRQTNETFAIKSGGHSPNKGFSSNDGGVLVSLTKLNEITLGDDGKTVRVGPGNRWQDIHKKLEGTGKTVIGGRIGHVGVGGYIVGGGLSFMSSEYGWAMNNVADMEVVLADGTVVHANPEENADLFKVLKGGGLNFGIVTTYTIYAYDQGQVWGGMVTYTADKTDRMLKAIRDFNEYYPDDKAGALIDIWLVFLYYNGPEPPPGVFDNFTDIGPLTNGAKTRSYSEYLSTNSFGVINGMQYNMGSETIPLPPASSNFMEEIHQIFYDQTSALLSVPGLLASMAVQPMPPNIVNKAIDRGGDLLAFDRDTWHFVIEFDFSYLFSSDDGVIDAGLKNISTTIQRRVLEEQASGNLPNTYSPLFMNDAHYDQDYWGRLKDASRALARAAKSKFDPNNFFAPPRVTNFYIQP